MKITQVTLWTVPLTSHRAYYMAGGKTCETVDTVVLRLRTNTGAAGWGEVCPIPHYLPAYAGGVVPAVAEMAPVLLGAEVAGPEALMDRLDRHLQGHPYAKSAVDTALWDLWGQACGQPLFALLGGRRAETLPLYHSITCIAPDAMAGIAREAQGQGIAQFQVKLGADDDWQADVERLRAVRAAVGPGPLVYGDWNNGADRLSATRVARAVADMDVMLEAPCPTMEDCAAVRAAAGLPMKMDELAHDTESLMRAHSLGIMDAVALKLSKFGGLSAMRRARDLCIHLGPKMCIEDTWGSDITTAALLHLGAATRPDRVLNVCDLSAYVAPRLDPAGPARKGGRIAPPGGAGLGVAPDPDALGTPAAEIG